MTPCYERAVATVTEISVAKKIMTTNVRLYQVKIAIAINIDGKKMPGITRVIEQHRRSKCNACCCGIIAPHIDVS
jgi:hypothetical protein